MSAAKVGIANYRRDGEPYFSQFMASIADSYSPIYNNHTKYGSCTYTGGQLRINNCNYAAGYIPSPMQNGNSCVCMHVTSGEYGCFSNENEICTN